MPLFVMAIPVLLLVSAAAPTAFTATCSASDRAALLDIRFSLSELYLGIFSTWTSSDYCSHWYGVSCDPNVADITLRGESEDPILTRFAHGDITSSISLSICRLDRLSILIIAVWKLISNTIPSCLPSSLPFLRILDLVCNRISNTIPFLPSPWSVSYMPRLPDLDLTSPSLEPYLWPNPPVRLLHALPHRPRPC